MREVVVVPPEAAKRIARVRKVQFNTSGTELAAWASPKSTHRATEEFGLRDVYRTDLASGVCVPMLPDDWHEYYMDDCGEPLVSPDLRWIAIPTQYGDVDNPMTAVFADTSGSVESYPEHPFNGRVDALFMHGQPEMCTAVVAEWNEEQDFVARVVRFDLVQLDSPSRTVERENPFTGEWVNAPVWKIKCKRLLDNLIAGVGQPRGRPVWKIKCKRLLDNAEWDRPTCAALSADGRFLAVADEPGNVHVADLKRKRVVAVHQKARLTADRAIGRVAVDNTGERVFKQANGVLHGPNWQFKPPSGKPTDFALSPDQRTLCAVFDSGHARTFDAGTGAILKELRWGKKPLYSVAFAPDGLTCAAGSSNGRVVIWDVEF